MANYTEHTIKLPDGIDLYYTDSEAPSSSSYTTLIVLHGTAFTGDGLVALHKYAHQNDLRVILWNRRGYRGSTKYTDAELEDLKEGRKVFQDRLAIQLAWFLEHFIKQKGTPKLSADRKSGGFILMGWSLGNVTTLSLLSDPDAIPKPLYEIVEPYLMSIVLYDPPFTALGLPGSETFYQPMADPDYSSLEEKYLNFQHWVTSYYKHPDIASGKPSGLSSAKRTNKRTINSWSEEEKEKCFDVVAAARSDFPFYAPSMQAVLKLQARQALFNVELASSYFPNINVLHISGTETTCFCMWVYIESSRLYKEAAAHGEKVRPIKFKLVEGGNHFLHYDMPELFLREVVQGCKAWEG